MRAEYFQDTDTLLLTFGDGPVVDTHDVGENVLVEFDAAGRLVAITIMRLFQWATCLGALPGSAKAGARESVWTAAVPA